ncbi:cation diffusion facilitator family transporter [Pseudoroseomonas cervicalis ATCC 49957]|uniref:Cation diffusion facilitator family transporter n=1 Tax=Pseudoroseomonas cervicalis ATCC 49957 TaxID=525371 RepID=D5RS23_9PROT|nr:cation diffusion facilitator family transporter [Pseudoroseomonas cervicalis ATCC 49957]
MLQPSPEPQRAREAGVASREDGRAERRTLTASILLTILLALAGIACGLLVNSSSILFDGVYSLADAALTLLALGVSVLLDRGETRRFQFGFWHLEPMLVLLNSTVLALSCGYALLGAVNDLLGAGRSVAFGPGLWYAAGSGLAALALFLVMRRRARALGSELLAMDARGWLVSGLLSLALGAGFLVAGALQGTRHAALVPYLDPALLAGMTLLLLPLPLGAAWRAGKEILQLAPAGLDGEVRALVAGIAERHGFEAYTTHVAKTGRVRFVDITFLAGPALAAKPLQEFEAVRAEIAAALGAEPPGHWLNIDFTTDRRWL